MHKAASLKWSSRVARNAGLACLLFLLAGRGNAVELTLVVSNVTTASGRTFQMPLTGADAGGSPLTFSIDSISTASVTGAIAPAGNRSLLLNVSGVDAMSAAFDGDVVLQLHEDLAPQTTARIIQLVNDGFYDGLTFHRVIQDFMCQGGDPLGNGTGGTGMKFDDEFVSTLTFSGFGQLAMANSGDDSNDSQFFITDADLSLGDALKLPPSHLNFNHTIFGQVTKGFDVLTKIIETPVNGETPITPVLIDSASIFTDTQGAVLRLSAATGFTGSADVTVRAMNTNNESAMATFQVTVVSNTVNDPPFLGPIPSSLTTTQGIAASFVLTATDVDNDPMGLVLVDAATGQAPTNLQASFHPATSLLTLLPNLTFTGMVELVLGVTDNQQRFDTQHFLFTVVPADGLLLMANLAAFKTASPSPVQVGSNLTYTITITNLGPDTATAVAATDTLPASVTFVSASAGCTTNGSTVTCGVASLNNGAAATFQIVVTPTTAGAVTNTVAVSADESDPVPANNTTMAVTTVSPDEPPDSALDGAFTGVKQKCKTKSGVTTCTLSASLAVQNSVPAELPPTHLRFHLSSDDGFDPGDDTLIGEATTKAIKAGKTGKAKLKATLAADASGSFLLAVDDDDAVVTAIQVPAP